MKVEIMSEGEALAGSVSPYQQQLAICTGGPPELWRSRVEEMEGVFGALEVALRVRGLHKQIKLTACDAPSTGAEGFDIFLLPDMLILPEITVDKVERLAEALLKQFEEGLPFDVQPMPGGDHIFVCTHGNRDERCGVWGPLLYTALEREIKVQDAIAHVHQTSHIGGHRFAATCIIYPQGVWYGNLRAEDAGRLVDEHLNHEQLLAEFYRGRLGTTAVQQVAEAAAVQQLRHQYPRYDTIQVDVVADDSHATAHSRARVPAPTGMLNLESRFELRREDHQWVAEKAFHFEERR